MPQFGASNFNLVDLANSSDVLLGVSGVFTGIFTEVSGYTTVTIHLAANEIIEEAAIEWSEDGTLLKDRNIFFSGLNPAFMLGSGGGIATHIPIKAKYYRVVVTNNNFIAQTLFMLQTQVVRGPKSGDVQPVILPPRDGDAGMLTKAVLFGQRTTFGLPSYTQVLVDGSGFMHVTPVPSTTNATDVTIPASLTSVDMSFGAFDSTRDEYTAFNDTIKGILYLKCSGFGAASLTDYHFKVPPQHLFTLPNTWRQFSGEIRGIWDVADGFAQVRQIH